MERLSAAVVLLWRVVDLRHVVLAVYLGTVLAHAFLRPLCL